MTVAGARMVEWARGLTLEMVIWILFWAFALGVVVWQLLISVHL